MMSTTNFKDLKTQLSEFAWAKTENEQIKPNPLIHSYLSFYGLEPLLEKALHQIGTQDIGGFNIVVQTFKPKNPTATVLMVHGYYDHVGLYTNLIDYCLEQNLNVVTFDLPGHGLSSGEPAVIDDFQQYDEVFTHILEQAHKYFSHPIYAFGQSTGGAIILNYLLKTRNQKELLNKAVLLAPLVRPVGWQMGFKVATIAQFFIQHIARKITTNPANPVFSDFIRKDPLQAKTLSVKWVNALRRWLKYWLVLEPIDFPLCVIQGDCDQTVDWQRNQTIIKQKFPKRELHILKDAQHALVNDSPQKLTEMFEIISQWLNKKGG